MDEILEKIVTLKHIMILTDIDSLCAATALYTYLLRLDKKVSIVCKDKDIGFKFSFLPWFDKIKSSEVSSSDFRVEFKHSALELYKYFKISEIKINSKMATSLYAGLLVESEGFTSSDLDGTYFAMAEELIKCGGNHRLCNKFIMQKTKLSTLRLKAKLLKDMVLQNFARTAVFYIGNEDLFSCGASVKDCEEILKEALKLEYVEQVVLLDKDDEYKVLKLIDKEK